MRWREAGESRPSPLERLAIDEQLDWEGTDDEWPEYAGDNTPQVLALGEQVILHHDYTVSLPRVFGAFFYARADAFRAFRVPTMCHLRCPRLTAVVTSGEVGTEADAPPRSACAAVERQWVSGQRAVRRKCAVAAECSEPGLRPHDRSDRPLTCGS